MKTIFLSGNCRIRRKTLMRSFFIILPVFCCLLSYSQYTVNGTVFNDANHLSDNTVNGTGTNAGGLNAILYNNSSGQVQAITSVGGGGTYNFTGLNAGNNYTIYITANTAVVGQVATPAFLLPFGWTQTGEKLGSGTGHDGTIDGVLTLGNVSAYLSDANFGIAQVCNGGTIYSLSPGGKISPFVSPSSSGAMYNQINNPLPSAPTDANGLAYNPANGKFYFFQVSSGGAPSQVFTSWDPATNTYTTLAGTGSGNLHHRGAITADGTGFYTVDGGRNLYYYNISTNAWVNITGTYIDQSGTNISTQIGANGGGDVAIDGSGNLWLLTGTGSSTAFELFKISAPLPVTPQASVVAKFLTNGTVGAGSNGIAFSSTGEVYATNNSTLYRINNNFSTTAVGALSNGAPIDLTSCAFPLNPLSALEFGDAPDSYGTLQSSNGARHAPSFYNSTANTAQLTLGAKIDVEIDGGPSVNADADNLADVNDEDAVTYFPVLPVNATTYSLTVNVTNTTGLTAYAKGWIDFNRNGVFDAGEGATATVPDDATSVVLTWTGLGTVGLTTGLTYSRFRIATAAAEIVNPTGIASDGEVEDYRLLIIGYSISGNVFEDVNAMNDLKVNGTGTNLSGALKAILYNNTNSQVEAITTVLSTGIYSFGGVAGVDYTVYITTGNITIGQAAKPVPALAGTWIHTGEHVGADEGHDGAADGKLALGVLSGHIAEANFGITVSVLPVKLTSFTVVAKDNKAMLQWQTASETNTRSFIIEYSTDGINWMAIGEVQANGNSNNAVDYWWLHNVPSTGTNYYRLKITDSDESYDYSPVRTLQKANSTSQVLVYPNPANGFINIVFQFVSRQSRSLRICGADGKIIKTIAAEGQSVQINLSNLAKGIYYISYALENGVVYCQKFVKL